MLDVAIIGSGMSGSAIAAEIEPTGRTYLVIEAGADRGRRHIGARRRSAAWADPRLDPAFRPFLPHGGGLYGSASGYRERLGGRSLYWRGICLRIEDAALADWPADVREALVGTGTAPGCYAAAEAALHAWLRPGTLSGFRTGTERAMVTALGGLGYPASPTPRAVLTLGDGRWAAYSPAEALPERRVVTGHRVTGVLRRAGGGYAVLTDGGAGPAFTARRLVLCAGTFGNVTLTDALLRENGGAADGRSYPLLDHVAHGFVLVERGAEHEPMDSSVLAGHDAAAGSHLVVERRRDPQGVLLDAWAMGEQPPRAAAALVLSGAPAAEPAAARVRLGGAAREVMRGVRAEQRRLLTELAARLGLRTSAVPGPLPYDAAVACARSRPGTAHFYDAGLGELDHEAGALPLGGEHVGTNGELRCAPGVFVAGPALFPRAGAANPTLTILALARWVARQLGSSAAS
ncbi:GMC family oxidoreductase [Streptomyces sp. MP131-18]|uniref:GMC family oxidoreductase n=1 Tax=Streptomyces sp. MP131-18 TaxID=1857892 RepID=UPI00097CB407|nr:GMC family oxidoreductase [Streptomyces sp. MP131-18]ONK15802.1 hypothetical protein STBA_66430 [Streptomyces sp. MP131-18]